MIQAVEAISVARGDSSMSGALAEVVDHCVKQKLTSVSRAAITTTTALR